MSKKKIIFTELLVSVDQWSISNIKSEEFDNVVRYAKGLYLAWHDDFEGATLFKGYEVDEPEEPTASVEIKSSDIATIEALHDLLLDNHGYSIDYITLKRARELTKRMNEAIEQYELLNRK